MAAPAITITGTFAAITGTASGSAIFTLVNYGNNIPTTGGFIVPTVTTTETGASFSVALYGNDVIAPNTTYYVVSFYASDGTHTIDVPYLFTGSGTFDISTLSPINPSLPPYSPAAGLVSPTFANTTTTNLTVTGTTTLSGSITVPAVNGKCNIAQFATGSTTGGIAEAIAAGYTDLYIPAGYTATLTTPVTITTNSVSITGEGVTSALSVNHTGNVFNCNASYIRFANLAIRIATSLSRGTSSIFVNGAPILYLNTITIIGNIPSPNNGRILSATSSGSGCGAVLADSIYMQEGMTWQNFVFVQNGSNTTTSASYSFTNFFGGGIFLDAGINLDGFIDTFHAVGGGFDGTAGQTAPSIWIHNDIGSTGGAPRWVHFKDFYTEAGRNATNSGGTGLKIDACRDFQYSGYIASALVAVAVGAAAIGVNVSDTVFVNIGQQGVTIANGAQFTTICNNYFDDTGNAANDTYNTVDVAAGASSFTVVGNQWRNVNGVSKPHYGINIATGSSDKFVVANNVLTGATFGATGGLVNNLASGANQSVYGNNAGLRLSSSTYELVASGTEFSYYSSIPGGGLSKVLGVNPNATPSNSTVVVTGQIFASSNINLRNDGAGNFFALTGTPAGGVSTWSFQNLSGGSDVVVGRATTDTLTNKTLDTAGAGNLLKINGTQVSAVIGTGAVVLATSPTLTTPNIGAATGTSLNVSAGAITSGTHVLNGATSGTLTLKSATVAGTNTLTLPAGTTDFSATGGTSQVVKQTSAGGAFTVAQLAASDLSNGVTGSGAVVLATSPTTTGETLNGSVTFGSTITSYNGVALASPGVATIVGKVHTTANTANLTAQTLLAAGSVTGGVYRVSMQCVITQAATTSSTVPQLRMSYTEQDSNGVTTPLMTNVNTSNVVGAQATNTTTNTTFRAKAGVAITFDSTGYVSSGATPLAYAATVVLEYLGS